MNDLYKWDNKNNKYIKMIDNNGAFGVVPFRSKNGNLVYIDLSLKTIIAGSRIIKDKNIIFDSIDKCPWNIIEVVSGTAEGVDKIGEQWAKDNQVYISRFPADWNKYGKSAGPIRNKEMIKYVKKENNGGLVLIWDGKSKGSANIRNQAMENKIPIFEAVIPQKNIKHENVKYVVMLPCSKCAELRPVVYFDGISMCEECSKEEIKRKKIEIDGLYFKYSLEDINKELKEQDKI